MNTPTNVRIVHPNGSFTPVELVYIGTEPIELHDDIRIIDRWRITTDTFMTEGDLLDGDIPENCSIIALHVGTR